MLRSEADQPEFEDFYLPFGGKIRSDNRWVKLAKLVPWDVVEVEYRQSMDRKIGRPALASRIAVGSLIVKERLGTTDEETVEQIRENPYLQYFLGWREYRDELPFDASMMVHFRKRFSHAAWSRVNEELVRRARPNDDDTVGPPDGPDDDCRTEAESAEPPEKPSGNEGTLMVDATCAPCDVRHPSNLSLMDEARTKTERLIDTLWAYAAAHFEAKPRTYRRIARRRSARLLRQKNPRLGAIRKELRYQLGCVERNLRSLDALAEHTPPERHLPAYWRRQLEVIRAFAAEQRARLTHGESLVKQTIYSLSQPHVRAIYRGKAGHTFEFGPKLSLAVTGGWVFADILAWQPYNEGIRLWPHLEAYHDRFGAWPEVVQADKIYRNRHNRNLCDTLDIRLSAAPLGRPGPDTKAAYQQLAQDDRDRNAVEGKIGVLKRRFSLNRLMGKLRETCESIIGCAIFTANLTRAEALGLTAHLRALIVSVSTAIHSTLMRLIRCQPTPSAINRQIIAQAA